MAELVVNVGRAVATERAIASPFVRASYFSASKETSYYHDTLSYFSFVCLLTASPLDQRIANPSVSVDHLIFKFMIPVDYRLWSSEIESNEKSIVV